MMWTAFVMGLGGSLHCAGMCSPLVMSVTIFNRHVLLNRIVYNVGRILVYGMAGAIIGSVGIMFDFTSIQNILSICLGTLLILIGFGSITYIRIPILSSAVNSFVVLIKRTFGKMLQRKNYTSLFIMGMLNGLLPCGLTYLTLTYTLTLQGAFQGFLFMILFGMGTLPVMVGLPFVTQWVGRKLQFNFSRITTVLMIFLGALLIVRSVLSHHPSEHQQAATMVEPVICR